MANITLEDYVNTYRNKIGGFRISSTNTNTMNISRNKIIQNPDGNKLSFLQTSFRSNINRLEIARTDIIYEEQTNPVINIVSLNIKNNITEDFIPVDFHNDVYVTWKNMMLVDTIYSKSVIDLDISDIVFPPVPTKGGGITDIELDLISGKYYKIILRNSDNIGISSIENLPASLNFNSDINSIEGVVFLIGTTITNITLSDQTEVKLTFNVVPASLNNGI
ncbi:hypothetical protein [Clostridium tyrobutyricum]|uniref:hypothetical protein n=1 Tax=Clostridium tyrobutyricum TaxID=1519 RepID=UPI0010AB4EBB|nr:hypothetical protein [Clostridium tyrobutyricum]QCH28447.1 hypothetical protein EZN00_02051 [Clostridium tyrobutyricum]